MVILKNKFWLHVFLPIFIGIMIYAFFRGLYLVDPTEKIFPIIYNSQTPNWIKYNLPDGLWLYSFLSIMIIIWKDSFSNHYIIWLIFAIVIGFGSEVLQAYNYIPGTFDWYDMCAYFIATILFYFNFRNHFSSKI